MRAATARQLVRRDVKATRLHLRQGCRERERMEPSATCLPSTRPTCRLWAADCFGRRSAGRTPMPVPTAHPAREHSPLASLDGAARRAPALVERRINDPPSPLSHGSGSRCGLQLSSRPFGGSPDPAPNMPPAKLIRV